MLLELASQEVGVGGFTAETVPILCEHHIDAASAHQVSHTVHARPLQACAALSGVRYLLEDLVPFSSGVLPEGLKLLGEGVARAGLLVCRDAGVEDGPED